MKTLKAETADRFSISSQERMVMLLIENKAVIILLVLFISMSFASDRFLLPTNLMNIIRQIAVYTVIGVGYTYVIASAALDMSIDAMIAFSGIIVAQLVNANVPDFLAIFIGACCGFIMGIINGTIIVRFDLPPVVVTLGMAQIYKGICYLTCNSTPIIGMRKSYMFLGYGFLFDLIPISVIIMIIVVVIAAVILYRTVFGRNVIAMGSNQEAARTSGINVKMTRTLVHGVAGVCCAIAAVILTGRVGSAQPTAGTGMTQDAICSVVLGGTRMGGGSGKVVHTVFGCLIVGIINNGLNLMNVDTTWQLIVKGALIIVAIVLDAQTERILNMINSRAKKVQA